MNTLKEGSKGPEVELLQEGLRRAGFYSQNKPDGVFGPNTKVSVGRFQNREGLIPDGIVGPKTWSALMPYLVGYVKYEVKPDDTLYSIATKYSTTIQAIQTANEGFNPEQLAPGTILTIPLRFPVTFDDISFTYQVLGLCIDGLKARYPFLEIISIGTSIEGKTLFGIVIGKGEKEVLYNASHHANEWITTPVLVKFVEEYAKSYSQNGRIFNHLAKEIYDNTTIYVIPMVNPDGVDLVTGQTASTSDYYKKANAMSGQIRFPSGWKANINGVDLNLNYPAGWEEAKRIKYAQGYNKPGPRDYVGPNPLSEPESKAMAEFTMAHDFRLTLSYHTQGEVIYWRYKDYLPEGSYEIGREFARVSGYSLDETPIASGNAGYKDWFIQTYNRPGYTIEVGVGVNPLPIEQFYKIYNDNIGILTLGAIL